ncbi:PHD finger protein MALE STERILITY 1 [Platanthera guangdongensis]|uniref:PHD finger protein MALE STERILITY 1 n=1 Tax=Platanthera guangdongensis TaxID=2320717 RepID=A0ABR2M6N1_9ASPA
MAKSRAENRDDPDYEQLSDASESIIINDWQTTRLQIKKDMLYLYRHVLIGDPFQSIHVAIPVAVNIVLDTKHLIKEYLMTNPTPHVEISCIVVMRDDRKTDERSELLPTEILRIPTKWTVGDMKRGVERYYRSTYCGLKGFVADRVVIEDIEMGGQEECELFVGAGKGGGGMVVVEGRKDDDEEIRFEEGRGDEVVVVVDCVCGAKEEDGERMVRCDVCEVWQHTRCVRIANGEELPGVFLCGRCESDIVALPFTPC